MEDKLNGTTEERRNVGNRRQTSLQVVHYPVLLLSHQNTHNEAGGVIWKTSGNVDCLCNETAPSVSLNYRSEMMGKTSLSLHNGMLIPHRSPKLSLGTPTVSHADGRDDRVQMWTSGGSAFHTSFDDRPSQGSQPSIYNSCSNLDEQYRSRKRRAGLCTGSTAGPFASNGGNGCNSAGYGSAGRPHLGGRSPQSSFDSNGDVAQISLNWMRLNGAVAPFKTMLQNQNNPKTSQSSLHLVHNESLKHMHQLSSIDSRWNNDGEQSSKKSISLVLSNDLEAQKGDDSETPLMNDDGNKSGGRLILREQYYDKRRTTCDRALFFAIVGIVVMIIESELRATYVIAKGDVISVTLKSLIFLSTLALLFFVLYFHFIGIRLFMIANAAEDWRIALTPKRILQVSAEMFACSLCPAPLEVWSSELRHSWATLDVLLSLGMFLRLYWLCRVMLLHSRLFTDASSRSIAGLNRVNFNARFILKTLMTLCPGTVLMIFTASSWIIAGWILRFCERNQMEISDPKGRPVNYLNSLWMIAITFLSVGYGDIVPHTYCGKTMAVITGILGTCTSSMVVAVIARKLELTRAEKHVHNFMMDTQLTKRLKHSAANVLRETWLIYKFRRLVEKPDPSRIRLHQRKFLVAIYELRKVKREQRKLAENFVSLGDVAKTTSNSYELIHDVHSTQEGLSLRITAIEHQLSDISRELSTVVELLRSNRRRSNASSDDNATDSLRRRKHGETM